MEVYVKHGCIGCHPTGGRSGVGPSLQGIFGTQRKVVRSGAQVTVQADEGYLRRSILHPGAEIVQGYPGQMPSYEEKISEEDLTTLISLIKSFKSEGS